MCQPAAPMAMKWRLMLVHSVRRVPPPKGSSSHRISLPPHLYSSAFGASARVTVVSVTYGVGAPTVVSFTVLPTVPRLRSASNGAHSRRCAGSVSACQTFSGEWRSSLTRMSVQFSPSCFRICAPLAGPGVYCARSAIFHSPSRSFVKLCRLCRAGAPQRLRVQGALFPIVPLPGCALLLRPTSSRLSPLSSHQHPALPACQLRELDEVAARILQHRNGRSGHGGGRHGELRAARLDPFEVALDVVGEEHGRGLILLQHRLLVRLGRGIVVQRQLQLGAVRLLGRAHSQPTIWALTEIGLLGKA